MNKAERKAHLEGIEQLRYIVHEWRADVRAAKARGDMAAAARCQKQMWDTFRMQRQAEQAAYDAGISARAISKVACCDFIPAR